MAGGVGQAVAAEVVTVAAAGQVIVHGGVRVITQQALSGPPERDVKVARELAANQWFGALRRRG